MTALVQYVMSATATSIALPATQPSMLYAYGMGIMPGSGGGGQAERATRARAHELCGCSGCSGWRQRVQLRPAVAAAVAAGVCVRNACCCQCARATAAAKAAAHPRRSSPSSAQTCSPTRCCPPARAQRLLSHPLPLPRSPLRAAGSRGRAARRGCWRARHARQQQLLQLACPMHVAAQARVGAAGSSSACV